MIKKKTLSFILLTFGALLFLYAHLTGVDVIPLKIIELTDAQYPDNPDIGFRATNYQNKYFKEAQLVKEKDSTYSFIFTTKDLDTIKLNHLSLNTWVPTVPKHIKPDAYLTKLALVNQEWNRNQVAFTLGEFSSTNKDIIRVDLAKNCLNSYLWEIILFTNEEEQTLPLAHGWFNFPAEDYQQLFFKNNGLFFEDYKVHLEQWKTLKSKRIDASLLYQTANSIPIRYTDLSNDMYYLEGERAKKYKEILSPTPFVTMKNLQSNQATFATFSPPGIYNTLDPRKTQLGRFANLKSIVLNKTTHYNTSQITHEIRLSFTSTDTINTTELVIGGLNFNAIPHLNTLETHKGWQNSMGFGNHSFYESFSDHLKWDVSKSLYYAYITDESKFWLDSHEVGIDGPILYFDAKNPKLLHLWLLSFERHALVGHYTLLLP